MYIVQFDKDLSSFYWSKVQIRDTGARAYHSATHIPKLGAVALVGGITSFEDGNSYRQKLSVILVDVHSWIWTEYELSNSIYLSSTKMLLGSPNSLVYFGGFTNHKTFETQEENCKSAYWGIVTFSKDPSTSEVTVDWNGKLSKLGSFACGDAVKVGPDFLISCGTEQKWGICSAATPDIQRCDLLSCTVGTEQEADYEKWIRYFHAYSRSNCIFC